MVAHPSTTDRGRQHNTFAARDCCRRPDALSGAN